MATNGVTNTAAAGATGAAGAADGATGQGNQALTQAFDTAISNAQKTLEISTVKGADLYALKQRPS